MILILIVIALILVLALLYIKSREKENKKVGCFLPAVIIAVLVGVFFALSGNDSSSDKHENYNDGSSFHQILAKNYFKDYIKDNLKDAKSYEEVDYSSRYNPTRECYEVTLKYRANNSFGAKVLEVATGDVFFVDDHVSIRNVKTE